MLKILSLQVLGDLLCKSIFAFTILLSLTACKRSDEKKQVPSRAEITDKCREVIGENFVYKTAAKFKIAVPFWVSNSAFENEFSSECELKSIKFDFAWVNEKLVPVPHSDHREKVNLPERYEHFRVMMSFKNPLEVVPPLEKWLCRNKGPNYEYSQFKIVMCPYGSMPAQENSHIPSLPYYPQFELTENKERSTSFSCAHHYLKGYTVDTIPELNIDVSCRGYWTWRHGASSMFDIGGKVIQDTYKVIKSAEQVLDSWLVQEPNSAMDSDAMRGSSQR